MLYSFVGKGTSQFLLRRITTPTATAAVLRNRSTTTTTTTATLGSLRSLSSSPLQSLQSTSRYGVVYWMVNNGIRGRVRTTALRALSSDANKKSGGEEPPKQEKKSNDDDKEGNELVLTPGEQVVVAGRLTMWAGIAVFASFCAYYIIRELMPTKMSPNRVFDRSFALILKNEDVVRRLGDPVKAYGRDHGGHREGRRNFIEHTTYKDEQDGSNRTRVRYNLEGRHGAAFVFAEVSSKMPSGEFVYVLVQDKSNGRVTTVVDNRAAITAARLSGNNAEAASAMSQLLSGSGSGGNK